VTGPAPGNTPGRSPGLDRATFTGRILKALGRDRVIESCPEPPAIDDALVRLVAPGPDVARIFARNATDAGMHVHETDTEGAGAAVVACLRALPAARVTFAFDDAPLTALVREAIDRADVEIVDWRETDGLGAHYDVDAGVTDVRAAIAETGSLVVASDRRHSRGTFVVPPVHVAVVRASLIRPDLLDHMRALPAEDMPACTVLVTGPSKTADIEGILITGVHGPGAVHIILVGDA